MQSCVAASHFVPYTFCLWSWEAHGQQGRRGMHARWEAMACHSAICAMSGQYVSCFSWAETGGSVARCLDAVVAVAAFDDFR